MLNSVDFTQDYLLDGRITIHQPVHGYRVAIDPVFLAASVQADSEDTILDIGAGIGAAALCLALRLPECRVIGLELQPEMVRLAVKNVNLNHLRGRVEILHGDLMHAPPRLAAGTYAHVMVNPPYLEAAKINYSPHENKSTANVEGEASLDQWAKFCLLMVRPKGTIIFIHRADRLDHILGLFAGKVGDISVYPLWPRKEKAAKRVIIRVRKNSNTPLKLLPGMVLHDPDGRYSREAEHILRDGSPLIW